MNDDAVAKLCREWLAVYDQAIEAAEGSGYQSVRHFHDLYEAIAIRSKTLSGEAAARGVESRLLSNLPARLHVTAGSQAERTALDSAAVLVRGLIARLDHKSNPVSPPGWFFKSATPKDLPGLVEWVSLRAGWVREWHADRFPAAFRDEIANQHGVSVDDAGDFRLWYVRDSIAHARYWLDHHGIAGYPIWHEAADDDLREICKIDEYFSELLSFLRMGRGQQLPVEINSRVIDWLRSKLREADTDTRLIPREDFHTFLNSIASPVNSTVDDCISAGMIEQTQMPTGPPPKPVGAFSAHALPLLAASTQVPYKPAYRILGAVQSAQCHLQPEHTPSRSQVTKKKRGRKPNPNRDEEIRLAKESGDYSTLEEIGKAFGNMTRSAVSKAIKRAKERGSAER